MDTKTIIRKRGQALIEVVVATMVVIVMATGLIASATVSIRNSSAGKTRSQATRLAQQAMEGARHQRNLGWEGFLLFDQSTRCFDDSANFTEPVNSHDECAAHAVDVQFTRSVSFDYDVANERMEVDVIVSWPNPNNPGGDTSRVTLSTYLTDWQ